MIEKPLLGMMCHFNSERKVSYLKIPRCGSGTIVYLLKHHANCPTEKVSQSDFLGKYRKEEFFCFTFVKHPLDRLISTWKMYKIKHSFNDFIDYIDRVSENMDVHIKPQNDFIFKNNKGLADFVGKVERFEKDFVVISNKLGCKPPATIPVLRQTNHSVIPSITKHHRDTVCRIYQKDFELFDYNIEDAQLFKRGGDKL